jgi:hypothetical protein
MLGAWPNFMTNLALAPFLRIWSEGGRRLLQPGCHPRCLRLSECQRAAQAHLVSPSPISIRLATLPATGAAMSSIRGVMLLPTSANSYRSHTAHHAFINKLSGSISSANRPRASHRLL